jgi:hypothetical protein
MKEEPLEVSTSGVGSSYVNTLFHVGIGLTAYLR